jgi:1,4-alpha-glucan branching enzyme
MGPKLDAPPEVPVSARWEDAFDGAARRALEAALPRWLAGRRWFGGKSRAVERVEIVDAVPVPAGARPARYTLLRVRYGEGGEELYAVPLAFAAGLRADEVRRELHDVPLAELEAGGERGVVYPAEFEPAFGQALLEAMARGASFEGSGGAVAAFPGTALSRFASSIGRLVPRPLGAEQSNTSLRFGRHFILKLYRRTEPGPNPELEVGTFLTDVVHFQHAPLTLGGLEYRPRRGEAIALGILQGFVANEGDAWKFTLLAVAEALGRVGDRPPPGWDGHLLDLAAAGPPGWARELAGPYLDAAALLGRRTAELHLALAGARERPGFEPEPFTPSDRAALREGVAALVRRNLALLRARLGTLAAAARAPAEEVLAGERELLAAAQDLGERLQALRIRTHGDYHLGQVLWTGRDFVVIDFEGEPAQPLSERRTKRSALRDVAGMVRSFHYAAYHGLVSPSSPAPMSPSLPQWERGRDLAPWAHAWYRAAASAFLRAYLGAARGAPFLPASPGELRALLDLFLVEKAAYELGYELDHRPEWVALPLRGLEDQLRGAVDRSGGGGRAPALRTAPGLDARGREEVVVKGKRRTSRAEAARTATDAPAPPLPAPKVLHVGGPSDHDLHLWSEGTNYRAYRALGAHLGAVQGVAGVSFAVWAPNAERVSVMGDFNGWDRESHPLRSLGPSGVWHGFVAGLARGAVYKYHLRSRHGGYAVDKADPFAFRQEVAPRTGSVVWDLEHAWNDGAWMQGRAARNGLAAPMSIYELHLGSWRRVPEEGNRSLTYRELAGPLADYATEMGFTHVELLPIMEHPFYGSWGYQCTGYFAPTSRYGSPQDLMYLVDTLHQRGVGVILDWVPSHFPTDQHALSYFDGTHLFEHADPRQGHHKDWDSYIFNYGRNEVRSFLLSSALYWLDVFHADGLRVDAVASMLYLDYSRKEGEWIPNRFGGRENLEAIEFLRQLNTVVFQEHPDVQTIAEESTSWPMVSRPTYVGGLGFGMKWDMGWMHDTLGFMRHDPVFRKYHHNEITFRMMYAFSENFVLSLSHDEVVHGKGSLLDKMWGHDRQRFAGLRLLYGGQWAQPGKKLLFMGGEIAQGQEWSHERSLDWHLLADERHEGVRAWVRDLNRLLREEPALHRRDFDPAGFEWVDCTDAESSVLTLLRHGGPGDADVLVVLNFTPVPRVNYRVGVPRGGFWQEALNGDAVHYGGAGWGNLGGVEAAPVTAHGRPWSVVLTLPPMAALFLRGAG